MKTVEEHILSQSEIDLATKFANVLARDYMVYKRIDKGQYETYCPFCDTYKKVNYKQLRQIQHSKYCPDCGTHYYYGTKNEKYLYKGQTREFISSENYGYVFYTQWNWGEPVKYISHEQIAYFPTGGGYNSKQFIKDGWCLNTSGYFYGHSRCNKYNYRYNYKFYRNFGNIYDSYFSLLNGDGKIKKYILETWMKDYPFKSNQKELIIKNRVSYSQILGIRTFDLKNMDEVRRYTNYFAKNKTHLEDFKLNADLLNVFYLDYLSRNDIDLGKFRHYMKNCKLLNVKLDKPKDFEYRLEKSDEMVMSEKDKLINNGISRRYPTLPTYSDDKITISSFESASQIRKCAKTLHNCMASYIESHSRSETTLYHLDIDGVFKIAIEIRNMELKQAYADHNSKCPDNLLEHIRTFCEQNHYRMGRYA